MTTPATAADDGSYRHDGKTERRGKSPAGSPPQAAGLLWFGGWLFTIGFAHLAWWKAILALVLWPYFLGVAVH